MHEIFDDCFLLGGEVDDAIRNCEVPRAPTKGHIDRAVDNKQVERSENELGTTSFFIALVKPKAKREATGAKEGILVVVVVVKDAMNRIVGWKCNFLGQV